MRIPRFRRPPRPREEGVVAILVGLAGVVLLGAAALAVDIGNASNQRNRAEDAADAAALAAAQELPSADAAVLTAQAYAGTNLGVSVPTTTAAPCTTGACTIGDWVVNVTTPYQAPGDTTVSDALVHVEVCRDVPTRFAGVLNVSTIRVCGKSTAARAVRPATVKATKKAPTCALCVLTPSGTGLSGVGSGTLTVRDGGVMVNSSAGSALQLSGSGSITVGPSETYGIWVYGGYSGSGISPTPETGVAPIPDPLASVPEPANPGGSVHGAIKLTGSDRVDLQPGIYAGITSSSSGDISLAPGVYVFTAPIKISKSPSNGLASIHGSGVTLYFACANYPTPCSSGQSGAYFDMTGTATVDLSPPTSGDQKGIVFFADRQNTAAMNLTGGSGSILRGTIYAKSGDVGLAGGAGAGSEFSSAVVANKVRKVGNSDLGLVFDPALNSPLLAQTTTKATVSYNLVR